MSKIYVLYHGTCCDGFGAAYAAWKKFGDTAEYIPVSYNISPPEMERGLLYILDFSYDCPTMIDLCKKMDFVVVLDHHKTAQAAFDKLQEADIKNLLARFDMKKSGARLAWEFFHDVSKKPVPDLILHIEDRDLWKFEMPGTREIHVALVAYPMDFKMWDGFMATVNYLIEEGGYTLRMHSKLVEDIVKGSWLGKIGEDIVPMVNTSIAWSEVGEALLKKYPDHKYTASFTEFEKERMWSLRSRADFDCSEVAKKYGGGGHAQACGFRTKHLDLEQPAMREILIKAGIQPHMVGALSSILCVELSEFIGGKSHG